MRLANPLGAGFMILEDPVAAVRSSRRRPHRRSPSPRSARQSRSGGARKRNAVELAFKAWPDRSSNRLAKQIGCSRQYVSRLRAQGATSCTLPERTIGADGKSYPARGNAAAPRTETVVPMPTGSAARSDGKALAHPLSGPVGRDGSDPAPETPAQQPVRRDGPEPEAPAPPTESVARAGRDSPVPIVRPGLPAPALASAGADVSAPAAEPGRHHDRDRQRRAARCSASSRRPPSSSGS